MSRRSNGLNQLLCNRPARTAARVAAGMGADVTVLERSLPRLRYLDDVFSGTFKNAYASAAVTASEPAPALFSHQVPLELDAAAKLGQVEEAAAALGFEGDPNKRTGQRIHTLWEELVAHAV